MKMDLSSQLIYGDMHTQPSASRVTPNNQKLKQALKSHGANAGLYAAAALIIASFFFFLSDGDFSFILTLGSAVRCFSFSLLAWKCYITGHSAQISRKTLQLYVTVFFSRLCSITIHEGYLPFDSSGDWLYPTIEALSLASALLTYAVVCKFGDHRAQIKADTFGSGLRLLPNAYGAVAIALPCLVLAFLAHPQLNDSLFTDVTWTFALYLETFAVLPQLFMFQRQSKGKPVEEWTSHFVATLVLSRLLSLFFWCFSYHELAGDDEGWIGVLVLGAQVVHLLVVGDFAYSYLKALKNGVPLVIGGASDMV